MTDEEQHMKIIDGLIGRIHLPREMKASYLNVHGGKLGEEWIEIRFPGGQMWKLDVERIK